MVIIESIKNYLGSVTDDELMELAKKIYMITDFICDDYPKHKDWYFTKQLPDTINSDERNILFVRNPYNNEEIISMACLKRDVEERKICTLYVSDKCRGLGIGTAIVEESLRWLGTTKPLVTLADYKLDMFKPIIERYNWELTDIVSGLYNNKSSELCFNGTLSKDNREPIEKKLYTRFVYALNYRIQNYK